MAEIEAADKRPEVPHEIEVVEKLHWDPQDILIVKTLIPPSLTFHDNIVERLLKKQPSPRLILFMRPHESIEKVSSEKAKQILRKLVEGK